MFFPQGEEPVPHEQRLGSTGIPVFSFALVSRSHISQAIQSLLVSISDRRFIPFGATRPTSTPDNGRQANTLGSITALLHTGFRHWISFLTH